MLPIPPGTPQEVAAIALLNTSKHPEAARQLTEWFVKPESIAVFIEEGYLPLDEK
jgi:molybdate transport system substrate-binding protein